MSARRARWGLGAVLGGVALAAALRAFFVYAGHGLWLGVAAVAVLAAIQALGFVTLGLARRRLVVEERRLSVPGTPDGKSELWAARRRALEAIRDRGATPDLDALRESTAADLGERAYLGRYLVAITVLVGLVGTFAGLMETMRHVAPLLKDESMSALAIVAGPLAGLDVTFGASIVGILVTLSLSLVQGDLVLAEERVLARLEERTRHELYPELWPPAATPAERSAGELAALRAELAVFLEHSVAATSTRVATIARDAVESIGAAVERALATAVATATERLGTVVSTAMAGLEKSVTDASAAQAVVLERLGVEVRALAARCDAVAEHTLATLADVSTRTVAALDGAAARTGTSLDAAASRMVEAVDGAATRTADAFAGTGARTTRTLDELALRMERTLDALADDVTRRLDDVARTQLTELGAARTGLLEAVQAQVSDHGLRLTESAEQLARAAGELRTGAQELAPAVAKLTPELAALGREVALLGARLEIDDPQTLVLDELARLGEDITQLRDLVALAQPEAPPGRRAASSNEAA
jgi:hypothetical protein